MSEPATVIHMDDGKAPVAAPAAASSYATAPAHATSTTSSAAPRMTRNGLPFLLRSGADGFRRCLAVIDFLLRVAAFGPTLAAAISTGTADERLSVFTQFFQFHARFDDFPAFTFFMVGNAIAAGYLVLSLPFSVVGILRPKATGVRLFLLVCDVVMMLLLTAAGAAAAAIVYVAHWGNRRANWVPICMQFHGFCQRTSGAVVATFLAVLVFIVLILMAACAIRRRLH
ncbi:casparian strip membrane protein 2-like [Phragmites australis]|uniref:casparian strip membrane protein 2-like n=1 Tax=Phragmites australis TaxID=29695 RepID=UPI002D79F54F|nr:casparian strip membrane protein 2-like [Phragmites australis]